MVLTTLAAAVAVPYRVEAVNTRGGTMRAVLQRLGSVLSCFSHS
jgi:hypothetical protein